MRLTDIIIDSDIKKAETLPSEFYKSPEVIDAAKEKIFLKSWHFVGHESMVKLENQVHPFILMEGFLSEPMMLTKDADGAMHCISNVCSHRGNLVALNASFSKKLTCTYHGRRFRLDGTFDYMPEFEKAENFPRPCDDLHKFPLERIGPFMFAGLNPQFNFKKVTEEIEKRIGFLPLQDFIFDPSQSKDYLIQANWALYCDNYLEGFHIPFVHDDLNKALDFGNYSTELFEHCNLQVGFAKDGVGIFDLPKDHIDYGKKIAAYYFWIFPNMMFNFYPWGLSINCVNPIDINRTKVSFSSYVYDASKIEKSAGSLLDKVEREDEFVVENVQKGVRSSFYKAGRFSPSREKGVHHFHRLISEFLNK